MTCVLGKNTIFTSSMISINYVLLRRPFYKDLKKSRGSRVRGGVFCFKWKTMSYSSCTQFVALTIFFFALYKLKNYKGLREKGPSNTVPFTWQQFVQGLSLCHVRNQMRANVCCVWQKSFRFLLLCFAGLSETALAVWLWEVWLRAKVTCAHLAHLTVSSAGAQAALGLCLHNGCTELSHNYIKAI